MFWKIFNHLAKNNTQTYTSDELITLLNIFDAGSSLEMFAYFEEHCLTSIINSKMEDDFDHVLRLASVLIKHQAASSNSQNRQFFNNLLKYFTLKLYQHTSKAKLNKADLVSQGSQTISICKLLAKGGA
jgi:hypothetical protein